MFPAKVRRLTILFRALKAAGMLLLLIGMTTSMLAQSQPQPGTPQQQPPPTQQTPPAAGGPQGDVGPITVPKKKEQPPQERPRAPKNPVGMPDYSVRVDVPLVNLDVLVTTKQGQFVPGLKKENFKVYEDGVPQAITNFNQAEAPITAVLLVEFAATNYAFMYDALNASYSFANMLKKDDWVAVIYYDMKPHILTDFTQDKREILGALSTLRIPTFRETNLFDALYDTLDRLETVQGRKYVILVSSGRDTFSRLTYDKILKRIQGVKDITIYPISTGRALREWIDTHYGMNPDVSVALMDYLQADNEMNTFARLTGGRAYFPRLEGELPDIFRDIGASIRNEYMLAYHPSNSKQDGTYRKLKVELVAPDGGPLKVIDEKGKELKINIIAREGYTAKNAVE